MINNNNLRKLQLFALRKEMKEKGDLGIGPITWRYHYFKIGRLIYRLEKVSQGA